MDKLTKLKEYCLEVLDDDISIVEKEDYVKGALNILRDWSEADLKSYAYCKSMDTMTMMSLLEHKSIDLSEKYDSDVNLQEEVVLTEGTFKTIMGIVIFGLGPWTAYRAVKNIFNKNMRKCSFFGMGREYDICVLRARIMKKRQQIEVLQKNMNDKKCDEKCKEKSKKVIEKLKLQIDELLAKLRIEESKTVQPIKK